MRRGSGVAEQMFPATGTAAQGARGADVMGSDKVPAPGRGHIPVAQLRSQQGSVASDPPAPKTCPLSPAQHKSFGACAQLRPQCGTGTSPALTWVRWGSEQPGAWR